MADRSTSSITSTRLDKWLWCARLFRTRTLAATAIRNGKVLVAGGRVKPSHPVQMGAELTIRKGPYTWRLCITGAASARGSAAAALSLYQESADSTAQRESVRLQMREEARQHTPRKGRPTKKERRDLDHYTGGRGP